MHRSLSLVFMLCGLYAAAQVNHQLRLRTEAQDHFFPFLNEMSDLQNGFFKEALLESPQDMRIVPHWDENGNPGVIPKIETFPGRAYKFPFRYSYNSVYGHTAYVGYSRPFSIRRGTLTWITGVAAGKGMELSRNTEAELYAEQEHLWWENHLVYHSEKLSIQSGFNFRYLNKYLQGTSDTEFAERTLDIRTKDFKFNGSYNFTKNQSLLIEYQISDARGEDVLDQFWTSFEVFKGRQILSHSGLGFELRRPKNRYRAMLNYEKVVTTYPSESATVKADRYSVQAIWGHKTEKGRFQLENELKLFGAERLKLMPKFSYRTPLTERMHIDVMATSQYQSILQNLYLYTPEAFDYENILLHRHDRVALYTWVNVPKGQLRSKHMFEQINSEADIDLFDAPTNVMQFVRNEITYEVSYYDHWQFMISYLNQIGLGDEQALVPQNTWSISLRTPFAEAGTFQFLGAYYEARIAFAYEASYKSAFDMYFVDIYSLSSRRVKNISMNDIELMMKIKRSYQHDYLFSLRLNNAFVSRNLDSENVAFLLQDGLNYLPSYEFTFSTSIWGNR